MQPASLEIIQKFLKIFFNLLYNQFAWTYDLVAWLVSIGQWKQWVYSVLPYLSGGRALELGHGPGHLQLRASDRGCETYGLDLSPNMGKICRKRLLSGGFVPRLTTASGIHLPFEDHSFTTVVATFPAEYLILPETLAQIYRVLEPGGTFVLLPLAWITGKGLFHRASAWLFNITGQSVAPGNPILQEGLKRFEAAGFQVEMKTSELPHSKVLIVLSKKEG